MQENEAWKQDSFGKYDGLKNDDRMAQFEEKPYVVSMPEKTGKTKKGAKYMFSAIFLIVMLIIVTGWCLWSGIRGLWLTTPHSMDEIFTNMVKGDVYEGEISLASKEYCELKHTINLIPAGTEHFYLIYSPEMDKVIVLRAPKGWDKDFSDDALNQLSLQERGVVRELDHKVKLRFVCWFTF